MGTHPSLPSKDLETQRTLLDLVQDNQALLSKDIAERYENKLPFLFGKMLIKLDDSQSKLIRLIF